LLIQAELCSLFSSLYPSSRHRQWTTSTPRAGCTIISSNKKIAPKFSSWHEPGGTY
jgi:hypothetical protein